MPEETDRVHMGLASENAGLGNQNIGLNKGDIITWECSLDNWMWPRLK
jgi:hypothetical protein